MNKDILAQYIKLVVEQRIREADISDGSKVEHGSDKHVSDLKIRIEDLTKWRDKQRKGSESRANYARLINSLKAQLASAQRAAAKKKK